MPEPLILSARFENALLFAAQSHRAQVRKGTTIPYVSHLLQVSGLVLEHGGDEDEAIAGLLHDVVEDTETTVEQVENAFGPKVAAIVAGCTDADVKPKPEWIVRKQAYLAHIATASRSVRLVSSCDKLHNARAILSDYQVSGEELWPRFNQSRRHTLWYYRSLVTAFQSAELLQNEPPSRVVRELDAVVTQIEDDVRLYERSSR